MSFFIGWKLSQGSFLAYKNLLHQTHDFSSLASRVAGSADLAETTMRSWEILAMGQGTLPSRLFGGIDIHDPPGVALPIHQRSQRGERSPSNQISQTDRSQRFHRRLIQRCQKPREGRTI